MSGMYPITFLKIFNTMDISILFLLSSKPKDAKKIISVKIINAHRSLNNTNKDSTKNKDSIKK